ncbi:MAG: hybrid sensor histidine kinase/response regulator [Gammaproteobacteria bacterium]|nr:hybrid sensor histidine kinase/response regulator [Gammaproteobacteria bacterium]
MMNQEEIEKSTILLVDDTPENLAVLVAYLEQFGFRLLVARSGREVLTRIEQVMPDIILLDVLMPEMDGFETCRRLKENDDAKDIPVIFMTALSHTVDKVKGFELGAVDYITKPFQHEEVLARVKAHLTIQKLQKDLNKALVRRSKREMDTLRLNITRTMPHEFRTPLFGIITLAELIVKFHKTMDKEKIVEEVRTIYESAEILHRLIQNYLMYAQLEIIATDAERVEKLRENCCLAPNATIEYISAGKARACHREADLNTELSGSQELMLQLSEEHLKKIVEELVSNAFKFSETGTPVRIKTFVAAPFFSIQISDNGRGIAPEEITRIGAYMQFERELYEQQGAGLGLIIAQRLVDLYSGKMAVDSAVGKGTTVAVDIPLAKTITDS